MIKLIDLLNEVKVNKPGRILNPDDVKALTILTANFGQGSSGFDLYKPLDEEYNLKNYEGYEGDEKTAIRYLLNKLQGTYVTKDIHNFGFAPGAPSNAFYTAVYIDPKDKYITVYLPYIANNEDSYVGWFDSQGKYYPDTEHFNEEGDSI